jgi:hypothetical protein
VVAEVPVAPPAEAEITAPVKLPETIMTPTRAQSTPVPKKPKTIIVPEKIEMVKPTDEEAAEVFYFFEFALNPCPLLFWKFTCPRN